jgi:succinyl-diaminopimelate desuccinylase
MNMTEEQILKDIEKNREMYIDFFRDVLKAKSYNPPGDELNVAKVIDGFLKKFNITSEIYPFGENRANLVASLNGNDDKLLLYNGHMDVVPPGNDSDWSNPPLDATIKRKKYIYGRGTTDMKGGLVAMIIALKILKSLENELSGNLIVNAVADEETGGIFGTKWCLDNVLESKKPDFTIIGESSGLNPLPKAILLGEKGHLYVKLITSGISCHASMPSLGKNAIDMMSEILVNLNKLENYIPPAQPPMSIEKLKSLVAEVFANREIFERILSEQPTLNSVIQSLVNFSYSVTMINGGIKENVVPDRCEAIIDVRLLPGQEVNSIIDGLKELILKETEYNVKDRLDNKSEEVYVYIEPFDASEGSYWKSWEESDVLKTLYNIIEKTYDKKPFYLLLPASADAHYIRNSGICPQTVLFGPGRGEKAHAVNEFIEIEDFINSIKVYALFAYEFLK